MLWNSQSEINCDGTWVFFKLNVYNKAILGGGLVDKEEGYNEWADYRESELQDPGGWQWLLLSAHRHLRVRARDEKPGIFSVIYIATTFHRGHTIQPQGAHTYFCLLRRVSKRLKYALFLLWRRVFLLFDKTLWVRVCLLFVCWTLFACFRTQCPTSRHSICFETRQTLGSICLFW